MRQLAGTATTPRKSKRKRVVPAVGSRTEATTQHGMEADQDDDELGHDAFEEGQAQLSKAGTAHSEGQLGAWQATDQHGIRGTFEHGNAPLVLGERPARGPRP